MRVVLLSAIVATVSLPASGQEKESPPPNVRLLMRALDHPSAAIRSRAAELLLEEKTPAVRPLVRTIRIGRPILATRAAVVLIERLDNLRHNPDEQGPLLKLKEEEVDSLRPLTGLLAQPGAAPWRWYLAAFTLDKLRREAAGEWLDELICALRFGAPMRQYAAVQTLYRMGYAGNRAVPALLRLLQRPGLRFRGLYVARSVIGDDDEAFTDEIGVYNVRFRLEASFVIEELFVLETLRRIGAAEGDLFPFLLALGNHESPYVRLDAARQLGLLDTAPARAAAADVLDYLLRERDSILVAQLADRDDGIRRRAVALFSQLGSDAKPLVPTLTGMLRSEETRLRITAAQILGNLGRDARAAAPALRQAIELEKLRASDDYKKMAEALEKIEGEELPEAK